MFARTLSQRSSRQSVSAADMSAWLLNVDADPKDPARDDVLSRTSFHSIHAHMRGI